MKRILFSFIFLLSFSIVAYGQISYKSMEKQGPIANISDFSNYVPNIPLGDPKASKDQLQALDYNIFDQYYSSIWNHLENVTPMAYDPISGGFWVVGMQRYFDTEGQLTSAPMRIKHTKNFGQTWDSIPIFTELDFGGFYPSIAVTNISGGDNFSDIDYSVMSQALIKSGTEWNFDGAFFIYQHNGDKYEELFSGPNDNNDGGVQQWSRTTMASYVDGENAYAYAAGILSPVNENHQYGQYGILGWNVADESIESSIAPTQWASTNFRPSGSTTQSYNGPMRIDVDNNGNIYAAVNNLFADDENNRVPAVSVSDDNGKTWSTFNRFPATTLQNYVQNTNFGMFNLIGAYDLDAFIVTGEMEWSYFFRIGLFNEGDQEFQEMHIVEAKFKDNTWSLVKAADLQGIPRVLILSQDFSDFTNRKWVYRTEVDPLGNELQAVKTADGKHIVLKWIDLTRTFTVSPAQRLTFWVTNQDGSRTETETTLDETMTSDLFTSYRAVGENNWSAAKNQTDDDIHSKVTWMPQVIPSLEEAMVIHHQTPQVTNTTHPVYGYPDVLRVQICDLWPYITWSKINITGTVSVETDEMNYSFALNNVYPNPASDYAEITFTLENTSNIKLELFNSVGQLVEVLSNGNLGAGVHAVTLNTANYTQGTYYYTLTVGAEKVTKMMNVIR